MKKMISTSVVALSLFFSGLTFADHSTADEKLIDTQSFIRFVLRTSRHIKLKEQRETQDKLETYFTNARNSNFVKDGKVDVKSLQKFVIENKSDSFRQIMKLDRLNNPDRYVQELSDVFDNLDEFIPAFF